MNRRHFLRTGSAASLAWLGAAQTRKRPNILILFTDDQRFSTIHALNNPEVRTPNIDKLLRRGVAFTKAHIMGGTIGAVCAPSRAMLITGQTLFHVHDSIVQPKPETASRRKPFDLFPEVLRRNGYVTFGTGKWHNGEALYARCFSRGANIFFGGMSDHLSVPVADFDPSGKYPKDKRYQGAKFSSELFSDAAIDFLRGYQGDDPFLAYVAFTAPHDPRMAPKEFAALYPPEKIRLPENFLPEHPFDNGEMRIRDEMLAPFPRTPQVVREHIAAYYAMITHVDHHIGRVLDALDETGRAKDTIVVFAADNGLAVGQHGLMGKQNLYEHSVRVPLVLAGPGVPSGKKNDELCYLLDLAPTLLEYAGVAVPETVEGKSLVPVINGRAKGVRDSVFYAYGWIQRGVRKGDWKLIRYKVKGKLTTQLFHLRVDPWEKTNLAGSPEHAAERQRLEALLDAWMKETDDPLRWDS